VNYYNEYDPHAAAWLRELIARNLIPAGVVDDRSITEIQPHELDGFTQCHFFAGIGLWPLALKLAGWPESRPVWTASLPCQPYSASGKQEGAADERNLWPVFRRLVQVKRPERVFGEQVAAAIGFDWLDVVSTEMESEGYTVGAAVLGAFSVGAPHQRQRLYWMAHASADGLMQGTGERRGKEGARSTHRNDLERCSLDGPMANSTSDAGTKHEREPRERSRRETATPDSAERGGNHGRLANGFGAGLEGYAGDVGDGNQPGRLDTHAAGSTAEGCAPVRAMANSEHDDRRADEQRRSEEGRDADGRSCSGNDSGGLGDSTGGGCGVLRNETQQGSSGHLDRSNEWAGTLIQCRDGKLRQIPVEPGLFPLANDGQYVVSGLARRRSIRPPLLRGAGNAIVPQVAAEFIQTCEEVLNP
jgi:DNA (cytosine-5)-methyltransferase 1